MERRYKVTSAPASEPISLTEAKNYLKVSNSGDDDLITELIESARLEFELLSNTAVIDQTIEEKFDKFPVQNTRNPYEVLRLTISPVISVTSVKYFDGEGVEQTLSTSNYKVDTHTKPARIAPVFETDFPDYYDEINVVTVTYKAGYADAASVPVNIKNVIYLLLADAYFNRTNSVSRYRTAAEKKIEQLRVMTF